jgi:hypothetical protein
MAGIYLRKKVKNSRGNPAFGDMSLEDLAWDCIADLFERNEKGAFIKLAAYFKAIAWERKSAGELEGATRRLIFSQVNQALYRIYREADPSLGKLLRNLKIATKASSVFSLVQRNGEAWICFNQENESIAALPVMPPEFLEAHLTASLRGEADVKQVLFRFAEILAAQPDYRKSYPLTGLALIIRSAFVHLYSASENETNGHDTVAPEEIAQMIAMSVETVKTTMRPSYVGKQKIYAEAYDIYFLAIRDLLTAEYVQEDGLKRSYYDYLRRHLETLTRENYQRQCRCHFEYLAKLTRRELLQNFKKEW